VQNRETEDYVSLSDLTFFSDDTLIWKNSRLFKALQCYIYNPHTMYLKLEFGRESTLSSTQKALSYKHEKSCTCDWV